MINKIVGLDNYAAQGTQAVLINGEGNRVHAYSSGVTILGNENVVYSASSGVTIINSSGVTVKANCKDVGVHNSSGVTVASGVEDIVLIRCHDFTATESHGVWINRHKYIPQSRGIRIVGSSSYNATLDHSIYLCDTSKYAGAGTLTLPSESGGAFDGVRWTIKLINASDTLTINTNGSELIDGGATKVLSVLNESVQVVYFDGDYYILNDK